MTNHEIARRLTEHARTLSAESGNVYRIRAYRQAAQTIAWLDRPLSLLLEEKGRAGLEALPGIGRHLSFTLEGLVRTGEFWTYYERDQPLRRVARAG
jgi:DNA polymerase/3'-5' exonuclease PolX